jgi:hypothetical protein
VTIRLHRRLAPTHRKCVGTSSDFAEFDLHRVEEPAEDLAGYGVRAAIGFRRDRVGNHFQKAFEGVGRRSLVPTYFEPQMRARSTQRTFAYGMSIPCALIIVATAGERRCLMKALAASGSLAFAPTAAVNTSFC